MMPFKMFILIKNPTSKFKTQRTFKRQIKCEKNREGQKTYMKTRDDKDRSLPGQESSASSNKVVGRFS